MKYYFYSLFFLFLPLFSYTQGWKKLNTTGNIPARSNASIIYTPASHSVIVFGGQGKSGYLNDLWRLDLQTLVWSQILPKSAAKPAPRFTHIAMHDSLKNRMLVWTGQGSILFNDVWAFNFTDSTWTELFPDGNVSNAPLKRYGSAAVFDPVKRNIINFAGFTTSGRFDDTWVFQSDSLKWTDQSTGYHPLKRCLTSQCFAPEKRAMIVFGGQSTGNLNDIWALDADTYIWSDLSPPVSPPSRHFNTAVYSGNGTVMIFGGNGSSGKLNDLWYFSMDWKKWDTLPQPGMRPAERAGHIALYVPGEDRMILWGGSGDSLYADAWEYTNISAVTGTGKTTEENREGLLIFPNPAKDRLQLSIPGIDPGVAAVLRLYAADGTLIRETRHEAVPVMIRLETETMSPGIYFLHVQAGGRLYTEKVLIVR